MAGKFNIYNLFNPNKDGLGVSKSELNAPRNLVNFFKFYWRNLGRLAYTNMLMILGNFPIFFMMIASAGYLDRQGFAPASQLYGPLYGALKHNLQATPATMALFGVHGVQTSVSIPTTATYVFYALTALIIFTFGFVNIGTTYILRNTVKGEPVFIWHDFWYAIKRNKKQAFIYGILDVIFIGLLAYDILFFYFNIGSFMFNVMFYFSLALAFIYFIMRFYIYIIMLTFDLSIMKILKNALIFSILGFKRNIMAVIGIAAVLMLCYSMLIVFLPIGIILPFIIMLSTCAFMAAYAAYPKIKEIMIDPYYVEEEVEYEEPIFRDNG